MYHRSGLSISTAPRNVSSEARILQISFEPVSKLSKLLARGSLRVTWHPYARAAGLYIKSFDHGSCELQSVLWIVGPYLR